MSIRDFVGKGSISRNEYELLEGLKRAGLEYFTSREAVNAAGWSHGKVHQVLSRLSGKNVIRRLRRGQYTLKPMLDSGVEEAAQKTVWPSYVSYWSALRKHNLTEQLPRTVFITNTRKSGTAVIAGFRVKYVKVRPYRFFGYDMMGNTLVAEVEKAIVDSLMQPKYAGGISEVAKSLREGWGGIQQDRLVGYALRVRDKTAVKRLGYLIEKLGLKAEAKTIRRLMANQGSGYSLLDPQKPKKGPCSRRWSLILNVEVVV
jgi:predicted transcriptional regulator of viral defense system